VAPANQAGVAVPSATSVIIASFIPFSFGMNQPTIVRSRGEVHVFPVGGADLSMTGAFGMCIVSADALAAGTGSIPRPFDDADWGGWFTWFSWASRIEFQSGVGEMMIGARYQVDSKAMRKIGSNEAVVIMAESQSGAVTVNAPLRLLFLMS